MSDATVTFTTPQQISTFRVLALIHGTALELATGMKPTRGFSAVRIAKQYGYTGKSSLKSVLTWLIEETGYEYKPDSMVARALAK